MSAFKKLDRRDVFTTVHLAKKSWSADSSSLASYGIEFYPSSTGSVVGFPGDSLVRYASIRQLFYSNYLSSSIDPGLITGSFENYLQSSLKTRTRNLNTSVTTISFPKKVTGEGIEPGSFLADEVNTFYIYDESNYVLETLAAGGQYIEDGGSGSIVDDGEGKLIINEAPRSEDAVGQEVGDIIYTHGLAILTDPYYANYFSEVTRPEFTWKSRQSIFTTNYTCKVRDEEMNFSLNPTSIKDSFGNIADNVSGSSFMPYVTTVGLYNDDQELIAVAKLGQPIPKSTNTDMTFVIKLDI